MAEQFEAILASDVNSGLVADDGLAAIKFDGPDGTFVVAIPRDKLMRLVSLCAKLGHQRSPIPGEEIEAPVIPAEWWSVSKGSDGRVVFGFEPEGGGMLAFGIYPDAALQLLEALAVGLGVAIPPKPEGAAN